MTPVIHSAELFFFAWLLFVALGSLFSALIVPFVKPRLFKWEPGVRHRVLVLLAALPLLTASVLMLSALLPSILSLESASFDHCTAYSDGHPHLCFHHLPRVGMNGAFVVLLASAACFALARAARTALKTVRALRVLRTLAISGEHRRDLGVTLVETSQPVCIAAGFVRPAVLLSRGLLESLSDEQRAVVLAHERAHVQRRDALIAWIARALVTLHLPEPRRWLIDELNVAAEQACDEDAARIVGDRIVVAAAILAVERLTRRAVAPGLTAAAAFGQCAAERRVTALLLESHPTRSLVGVASTLGAATAVILAFGSRLHDLTESLISMLAY